MIGDPPVIRQVRPEDKQRMPWARLAIGTLFGVIPGYLGLTSRKFSTGAMRRLGRISKRGCLSAPDRLRSWAIRCEARRGHNKAAVALANKMARIAWSVWSRGRMFVDCNRRERQGDSTEPVTQAARSGASSSRVTRDNPSFVSTRFSAATDTLLGAVISMPIA